MQYDALVYWMNESYRISVYVNGMEAHLSLHEPLFCWVTPLYSFWNEDALFSLSILSDWLKYESKHCKIFLFCIMGRDSDADLQKTS